MKKLFLTSSFADVAKRFPDFAGQELNGKTVAFISTASAVEAFKFYVRKARKSFKKLGIAIDELDVSIASKEEINKKLEDSDFIYVSGGNTFYLLQELKRTEADKVIIEQINKGKIYIGESAGSIILSPDIEYVEMVDDRTKAESLSSSTALGVVDFYPLPHHDNFPFKKIVEKIIVKYEAKLNLKPISNNQVITVSGDKVDCIG